MKKNIKNTKESCTDILKSIGKMVLILAIFVDTTRKGALSEEVFIHKEEITVIKIALNDI